MGRTDAGATVLRVPLWIRVTAWVVAPLAGVALGWFLPRVADWATGLPWAPFQGPFELVASWDGSWVGVVLALVGLTAGVLLAAAVAQDTLSVRVTDHLVSMSKERRVHEYQRADVGAVFVDGKHLVLLGTDTQVLARDKHETTTARLAAAFQEHGYPWAEGDPHAGAYRRWVDGTPDLPGAVNALLRVRQLALEKKRADEASELADEASRLGYVVRDEGTGQYWRTVRTS